MYLRDAYEAILNISTGYSTYVEKYVAVLNVELTTKNWMLSYKNIQKFAMYSKAG